jgi:hypothetical protein
MQVEARRSFRQPPANAAAHQQRQARRRAQRADPHRAGQADQLDPERGPEAGHGHRPPEQEPLDRVHATQQRRRRHQLSQRPCFLSSFD